MSGEASPRLPVFDGTQRVLIPELWMRKFEDFSHLMQWSDDEAVRQFRQHLSGSAECWYHSLQEEDTARFDSLKRVFKEHFYRVNIDPAGLQRDLESRKQAPDETVEDYLHQKLIYILQSDIIQTPEAVDLVYNGLLPALRELINIQHISSLEELQRTARKQYVRISRRTGCILRHREINAVEFGSIVGVADGTVGTANTAATVNGGMGNTNVHFNLYQPTSEDRGEIVISCLRALNRGEDIAHLMNEFQPCGDTRNTNRTSPEPARTHPTNARHHRHPSLIMEEPSTTESHMLSRQSDDSSRPFMSTDPAQCTVKPRISDNSFVAHPEDERRASLAVSHEMYSHETLSHRTIYLNPYEELTSQKLSKCHVTHPEGDTSAEISLEIYPQKANTTENARYTRISGNWLRTHPVDDQNSLYTCPLSLKDDLSKSVGLTDLAHPDVNGNGNSTSLMGTVNICTSELPPESVMCYSMGNKSFVPHSLDDTLAIFDRTDDVLPEDTTFRKIVDGSSSGICSHEEDDHGGSLTYRKTFDLDISQVEAVHSYSLYEPVVYSDTSFHSFNVRDPVGVAENASLRMSVSCNPKGIDVAVTAIPDSIDGPASTDDLSMCHDSREDPTPCMIITTMRAHTTRPDESRNKGLASQDGVYRIKFDMDLAYCVSPSGNISCTEQVEPPGTDSWDYVCRQEYTSHSSFCKVSDVWKEIY
ncbi:uncharacterized protein [Haliotis asinina]|uniref:uncharacterized protein isoform X2 n=1 Tax=Haliotis asinina TaxID=109174 RepID=UPI003531C1DD